MLEPWVVWSALLPCCSSWFICLQMWGHRGASHHLVGSASCSLACPIPQSTTSLGPPAHALPRVLTTWLLISAPPTDLGECFSFISLVVALPYSSIFCQFWMFFFVFLFLNCCCPSFGCARRCSVSTYASILAVKEKFERSEGHYFTRKEREDFYFLWSGLNTLY